MVALCEGFVLGLCVLGVCFVCGVCFGVCVCVLYVLICVGYVCVLCV